MQNLVDITYNQTGASSNTNEMGMREMQQYPDGKGSLLLKVSDIQFDRDDDSVIYTLEEMIEQNILCKSL